MLACFTQFPILNKQATSAVPIRTIATYRRPEMWLSSSFTLLPCSGVSKVESFARQGLIECLAMQVLLLQEHSLHPGPVLVQPLRGLLWPTLLR